MGERDKGRERQFDLKFERKRKSIKYFARLKTKTHYGGNSAPSAKEAPCK